MLLGLDVFQIAGTVRTAFEGMKATVFRDGDEEVDVVVKFRGDEREKLSDIERMRIASRSGAMIRKIRGVNCDIPKCIRIRERASTLPLRSCPSRRRCRCWRRALWAF